MPTQLHQLVRSSDLSPITKTLYLKSVDDWIAFAGADPSGWTTPRVNEFYADLLSRMKPQSANRVLAGVAHASRWLSKINQQPDFCVVQKHKKVVDKTTEALSWEDASLLLNTTEGNEPNDVRDRAIMVLGLETGMRVKSLRDVRMDQIHVTRDVRLINVKLKGSRDVRRPVPLSDTAMLALETWNKWMRSKRASSGYLFQTLVRRIDEVRLVYLASNTHEPLTPAAIYQIVRRRGESVGLTIYPHVFRTTFVTWRLAAGYAPHQVAAMTWHSMTLGAMGGYIDKGVIGKEIANSTPPWLSSLVQRLCS